MDDDNFNGKTSKIKFAEDDEIVNLNVIKNEDSNLWLMKRDDRDTTSDEQLS